MCYPLFRHPGRFSFPLEYDETVPRSIAAGRVRNPPRWQFPSSRDCWSETRITTFALYAYRLSYSLPMGRLSILFKHKDGKEHYVHLLFLGNNHGSGADLDASTSP